MAGVELLWCLRALEVDGWEYGVGLVLWLGVWGWVKVRLGTIAEQARNSD